MLVYSVADVQGVAHRFNKDLKMAGKKLLFHFLERHSNLSIRKPEPTNIGRVSGFNREQITHFYQLLKTQLLEQGYATKQIYNVDESGITVVLKPPNNKNGKYRQEGAETCRQNSQWEKRENSHCHMCS